MESRTTILWRPVCVSLMLVSLAVQAEDVQPVAAIECGPYRILLDGSRAWTMREFSCKDHQLLSTEPDAFNGSVLKLSDGEWIGSGYGGEKVSARTVTVDGKRKSFKEGSTYTGRKEVVFSKTSQLKYYRLRTTLKLTPDGLVETHEYKRTRKGAVDRLYAFVFCWMKDFQLFTAQIPGDNPKDIMAKRFNGMFYDEEKTLIQEDLRYFSLYCTLIHTGVVCIYGDPYKYQGEEECTCLRDTGKDRRVHFRPKIDHEGRTKERMEFSITIKAFECPTGKLQKTAATLAGSDWQ